MSTASSAYDYRLFGLSVRSELELPELFGGEPVDVPDVAISLAKTGGPVDGPAGLYPDGDALVLIVADVGRFRIAQGQSIIVEPLPGVPARNVRLFLLGSAFGVLLHQRGLLPLHANAIDIGGRAIAFMGGSGSGKSTLAAWFHDQGYPVLADDVCVVRFAGGGQPSVCAGLPRLRLREDVIELTGREAADFERSYIGAFDKFDVPIPVSNDAGGLPLAAIYALDRGDLAITPLTGVAAAQSIIENTYRGRFVAAASTQQSHWRSSVEIVRRCPIFHVRRPWSLAELERTSQRLLDHARSLG